MIYFISKRTDHDPFIYKSQKIKVVTDLSPLVDILTKNKVLGFDTEATGKRYWLTKLLLMQIGNNVDQVIIDFTRPSHFTQAEYDAWIQAIVTFFNNLIQIWHLFVGHNLKYDKNVCKPYGFNLPDFFDTMIAEQRINLGSGLLNNLADTYFRRLKKFMKEDKEIRQDFIYMNENSKLKIKHLMYAAGDVEDIIEVATEQKKLLSERSQAWFVRNVEFPLVPILGESEMTGLFLDEPEWTNLIVCKKKRKFELEKQMDQEVRTLGVGNMYVTGGKFTNERKKEVVIQPDLFGGESVEIENKNTNNINYNSTQMVVDVIDRLKLPKPTFLNSKKEESDSLREEAIQAYLMEYPNTPIRKFLENLLEYKGLQKFISSYGEKFLKEKIFKNGEYKLGFKNPITHRVHTVFKQCFTDTGRLSSGEKDEGCFNGQNLPSETEVKKCFRLTDQEILDGWLMTTCDLSGAELIIMAALADDQHLFSLGADKIVDGKKVEGDLHSPIATKCWRAVYEYRKSKLLDTLVNKDDIKTVTKEIWEQWFTIQDSKAKKYILTHDFLINKQNNKQLRTDFKPMVFGCVYGLKAKKGSETLNIPKDDAQVIIDVIKREFPKTFAMVERAVEEALYNGYVVFNSRCNSRRLFTPVLDILNGVNRSKYTKQVILSHVRTNLDYKTISEIEGAARNCRIQGTQASMLKEIMVEINKYIKANKIEAKLLLNVHDELVYMHKGVEFGKKIKEIMIEVANRYLEPYTANIRMGAEGFTATYWTKEEPKPKIAA